MIHSTRLHSGQYGRNGSLGLKGSLLWRIMPHSTTDASKRLAECMDLKFLMISNAHYAQPGEPFRVESVSQNLLTLSATFSESL